jgi:hypothetical protein
MRAQVKILSLVLLVAGASLAFAALKGGTAGWSGAMFSIWIFTLLCAPLGIALGRGPHRAYWLGYATLGWSYVMLLLVPWLWEHVGQYLLAPQLFGWLSTNREAFGWPEEALRLRGVETGNGTLVASRGFGSSLRLMMAGGSSPSLPLNGSEPPHRIVIALEGLLWAYLGGWTARIFASGRSPRTISETGRSTPSSGPEVVTKVEREQPPEGV